MVPSISRWQWHPITVAGTEPDASGERMCTWRAARRHMHPKPAFFLCMDCAGGGRASTGCRSVPFILTCMLLCRQRVHHHPEHQALRQVDQGGAWRRDCRVRLQRCGGPDVIFMWAAPVCLERMAASIDRLVFMASPLQELLERLQRRQPLALRVSGKQALQMLPRLALPCRRSSCPCLLLQHMVGCSNHCWLPNSTHPKLSCSHCGLDPWPAAPQVPKHCLWEGCTTLVLLGGGVGVSRWPAVLGVSHAWGIPWSLPRRWPPTGWWACPTLSPQTSTCCCACAALQATPLLALLREMIAERRADPKAVSRCIMWKTAARWLRTWEGTREPCNCLNRLGLPGWRCPIPLAGGASSTAAVLPLRCRPAASLGACTSCGPAASRASSACWTERCWRLRGRPALQRGPLCLCRAGHYRGSTAGSVAGKASGHWHPAPPCWPQCNCIALPAPALPPDAGCG